MRKTQNKDIFGKIDALLPIIKKILLMGLAITIPLLQFFRMYALYFEYQDIYDNVNTSSLVYITLPILLIIYIYQIIRKTYKIGIKDYILYFLTVLAIISTIGALSVNISLYGAPGRYEGLFAIIFYYLLILVGSSVKDKKFSFKIINTIIVIGIIQTIYAVFQVYIRPVWILNFTLPYMANGFSGNPNFYGTYMAIALLISIGSYLFSSKHKTFYFFAALISSFGIALSNSFGPLTGILVGSVVLLILIYKKYRPLLKKCLLVLIISALTIISGAYVSDNYCKDKFNDVTEPGYTLRGDFDEIVGTVFDKRKESTTKSNSSSDITMIGGRRMVWERSLAIASDHYWFGVGLDNFATAYAPIYEMYIDKAHNVYLNILVNNGIFAFVGYIILMIYILVRGFKKQNRLTIILLITSLCYMVQAVFSINVLEVAPYFYIICGLLLGLTEISQDANEKTSN